MTIYLAPTMHPFFLSIFITFFVLDYAYCNKCNDGIDNVITFSEINTESSIIHLKDIKLATYDRQRRPHCNNGKAELVFPGFVKAIEGEVIVTKDVQISKLQLLLTAKHNSFFIGDVCKDGKSVNTFVDDEICSLNLCDYSKYICRRLSKPEILSMKELIPELISIPETEYPLEGEWNGDIVIQNGNENLAKFRLTKEKEWLKVKVDEHDEDYSDHEEL